MRESAVEDWVCAQAQANGWLVRKLSWVGRRNACDRFFAKDGRIVLMELKAPGESARPGQERERTRLQGAGVEAYCVNSPVEALRILGVSVAGS